MKRAIIFDLDLTLVDSTIAEYSRKIRDWPSVYSLIPRFALYPGMDAIFDYIRTNQINVAIVSTAPRSYIEKVVRHFDIPVDVIVGYHDARPIKPHPAPMLRALELLGVNASDTVSLGDRAIDIYSSKNAGIIGVGCLWGTKELDTLMSSNPDYVISTPLEVLSLLK